MWNNVFKVYKKPSENVHSLRREFIKEWIWSEIFIFTHFGVTSVIFEWSLRSLQNEWKYTFSL